jgi:predicted MPP superfamily phosphohydrolase
VNQKEPNRFRPMREPQPGRRRFLKAALLGLPALAAAIEGFGVEPRWLTVRQVKITAGAGKHRLVQFSDLHHRGDAPYLRRVVEQVNALQPDYVCFTGDIVEKLEHLDEALEILRGIKSPMYGVPGNWEYWALPGSEKHSMNAPENVKETRALTEKYFAPIRKCFEATGGRFIEDSNVLSTDKKINFVGATGQLDPKICPDVSPRPGVKNIFLMHYPAWPRYWLPSMKFDLTLSGHSHGGQVRLPGLGALRVPDLVDEYSQGLFTTKFGPLYVNAGIGYSVINVRFLCRPEITLIEI